MVDSLIVFQEKKQQRHLKQQQRWQRQQQRHLKKQQRHLKQQLKHQKQQLIQNIHSGIKIQFTQVETELYIMEKYIRQNGGHLEIIRKHVASGVFGNMLVMQQ